MRYTVQSKGPFGSVTVAVFENRKLAEAYIAAPQNRLERKRLLILEGK